MPDLEIELDGTEEKNCTLCKHFISFNEYNELESSDYGRCYNEKAIENFGGDDLCDYTECCTLFEK